MRRLSWWNKVLKAAKAFEICNQYLHHVQDCPLWSSVASFPPGRKSAHVRLPQCLWGRLSIQSTSQGGRFCILAAILAVRLSMVEWCSSIGESIVFMTPGCSTLHSYAYWHTFKWQPMWWNTIVSLVLRPPLLFVLDTMYACELGNLLWGLHWDMQPLSFS